jgi:endonuclease YncB( thermonuclease family)
MLRRKGFARLALLISLLLVGVALTGIGRAPIEPPPPAESVPAAPPPEAPQKIVDRIPEAVRAQAGADLSAMSEFTLAAPFVSASGTSLLRGSEMIRLDGVEGPGASDVCLDESGAKWACGLQARAALHNLLAGSTLYCKPRQSLGPDQITGRCVLGSITGSNWTDRDLAFLLVELGWARPTGKMIERLAPYARVAQEGKLGLWRGDWTIAPPARVN